MAKTPCHPSCECMGEGHEWRDEPSPPRREDRRSCHGLSFFISFNLAAGELDLATAGLRAMIYPVRPIDGQKAN